MIGIIYLFIVALIGLVVVLALGVTSVFAAIITVLVAPALLLFCSFFTQKPMQAEKSKDALLAYHQMKYGGYEDARNS